MDIRFAPVQFNPSQEMTKTRLEIRYVMDVESPHVDFHAHPFYEIYYFLEGPVESYVVDGRSYQLRSGDILMMPPGVPHHPVFNQEQKPYRRYVLWLSAEQMEMLGLLDDQILTALRLCQEQQSYQIRCATPSDSKTLEGCLSGMWKEEQGDTMCKQASMYSLCLRFLVTLNRIVTQEHLLMEKYHQPDSLLEKVLAYIRDNYTTNITLNAVAEHFFTSPSNIETLLTKRLGKPFYRYVTECRIIRAQTLIVSGMPLKEVGHACGYNDYSNFYRAFSREVGISPSKYRQHSPTNHYQSTNIKKIT